MSEDVKVGNFNKPTRRPVPKSAVAEAEDATKSSGDSIADLNVKMDKLLDFMQAVDWKMWVYLKANNYID